MSQPAFLFHSLSMRYLMVGQNKLRVDYTARISTPAFEIDSRYVKVYDTLGGGYDSVLSGPAFEYKTL